MNLIYENNNSVCPELCEEIINLFEKSKNKFDGLTVGGVNKKVKDTTDLMLNKTDSEWSEIFIFLESELTNNLKKYLENINKKYINILDNNNKKYEVINKDIVISPFMVQRYIKNEGKYVYHNDFLVDKENKSYRVLTYLFYLNDVHEGGETEFLLEILK